MDVRAFLRAIGAARTDGKGKSVFLCKAVENIFFNELQQNSIVSKTGSIALISAGVRWWGIAMEMFFRNKGTLYSKSLIWMGYVDIDWRRGDTSGQLFYDR